LSHVRPDPCASRSGPRSVGPFVWCRREFKFSRFPYISPLRAARGRKVWTDDLDLQDWMRLTCFSNATVSFDICFRFARIAEDERVFGHDFLSRNSRREFRAIWLPRGVSLLHRGELLVRAGLDAEAYQTHPDLRICAECRRSSARTASTRALAHHLHPDGPCYQPSRAGSSSRMKKFCRRTEACVCAVVARWVGPRGAVLSGVSIFSREPANPTTRIMH